MTDNSDQLRIFQVDFGTPEYDETVRLRDLVLRKPLGLEFTVEQLATEYDSWHLIATNLQGELLACLILTPMEGGEMIKMRQVAVRPDLQGQGVGAALVQVSEKLALERNFREMVLHARETAVPFYLKLGYSKVGDRFSEVNIPHFKMRKVLV